MLKGRPGGAPEIEGCHSLQEAYLVEGGYYGLNCFSHFNSYVEASTPKMTVFGDRDFREVIKVK